MNDSLKLNVGCGADSWGDIRLDIAKTPSANIIGDAQFLPFKTNIFEETKASHVLEHLENPSRALAELVRVTRKKIIIKFPIESDWKPLVIRELFSFPFSIKYFIFQFRPKLHKWIVNPNFVAEYLKQCGWKVKIYIGKFSILGLLEGGRKAQHFKWLTKHIMIPFEYKIEAVKGENEHGY
ncbi:MAG: methyltransferase domain-containing protein [Candidatus Bathyarchaeales archaeon]